MLIDKKKKKSVFLDTMNLSNNFNELIFKNEYCIEYLRRALRIISRIINCQCQFVQKYFEG